LAGNLPPTENIKTDEVVKAFAFDKKQTSNSLQWILLEAIGKPKILQSTSIPSWVVENSIEKIIKK
jgi:3-dehydroquinate synthetase